MSYTVDRVDVALEIEQWAVLAAQASAAQLAYFSISNIYPIHTVKSGRHAAVKHDIKSKHLQSSAKR